jgi:nucleoid-associated protein YgaU
MRAALWIAVLLAAFVLAWRIQDRWAAERREERDAAYGLASESEDGFGRVIVGEPSGAAPILVTPPPAAPTAPVPNAAGADRLRHHVVQKGEALSKICAAYYGTARKDVVEAVARANGLASPEMVRAGQRLVLPPLAELKSAPR